jgi:hypothetical protein
MCFLNEVRKIHLKFEDIKHSKYNMLRKIG